jgi:hypothetical protein
MIFVATQKLTERRLAMNHVKSSRLDFRGQPISIGLDVHKKSWSVSIFSDYGEYKTFNQPPEVDKLLHYLRHHFPGGEYRSVYEAGYCGFWIHDQLREKGIQCLVANPADIPTKNKERRSKRDRIDCRKLAGRSLKRADGSEGQINTSYIERDNLALRQELRRLARKTLGFSKNRRELQHALDFIDTHDNFVKPHGALRLKAPPEGTHTWVPRTPAMAAGISDHVGL